MNHPESQAIIIPDVTVEFSFSHVRHLKDDHDPYVASEHHRSYPYWQSLDRQYLQAQAYLYYLFFSWIETLQFMVQRALLLHSSWLIYQLFYYVAQVNLPLDFV